LKEVPEVAGPAHAIRFSNEQSAMWGGTDPRGNGIVAAL